MSVSLLVVEDEFNIMQTITESIQNFIIPKFNLNLLTADRFYQAKELIYKN